MSIGATDGTFSVLDGLTSKFISTFPTDLLKISRPHPMTCCEWNVSQTICVSGSQDNVIMMWNSALMRRRSFRSDGTSVDEEVADETTLQHKKEDEKEETKKESEDDDDTTQPEVVEEEEEAEAEVVRVRDERKAERKIEKSRRAYLTGSTGSDKKVKEGSASSSSSSGVSKDTFKDTRNLLRIDDVSISLDNEIASCGNSTTTNVLLWSIYTKSISDTLKGHANTVRRVKFNPARATMLVSGDHSGTILVWDTSIKRHAPVARITAHTDQISQLVWHSEGDRFVSNSMDGITNVWDMRRLDHPVSSLDINEELKPDFFTHLDEYASESAVSMANKSARRAMMSAYPVSAAWHPQFTHLLCIGYFSGNVRYHLTDRTTSRDHSGSVGRRRHHNHNGGGSSSSSGVGVGIDVSVYDTDSESRSSSSTARDYYDRSKTRNNYKKKNKTKKCAEIFMAHDGSVNSMAFHPSGATLCTIGYDKRVKIWSVCRNTDDMDDQHNFQQLPLQKREIALERLLDRAAENGKVSSSGGTSTTTSTTTTHTHPLGKSTLISVVKLMSAVEETKHQTLALPPSEILAGLTFPSYPDSSSRSRRVGKIKTTASDSSSSSSMRTLPSVESVSPLRTTGQESIVSPTSK